MNTSEYFFFIAISIQLEFGHCLYKNNEIYDHMGDKCTCSHGRTFWVFGKTIFTKGVVKPPWPNIQKMEIKNNKYLQNVGSPL